MRTSRGSNRWWPYVGLFAALGLIIRVVYVLGWRSGRIGADSYYYHYGANLLADGRGFIDPFWFRLRGVTLPGANHPPGFAMLLAAGSLVGLRSVLAHQLLSCAIGTVTIVAIGWTSRRVVGPRAGLIAAFVAAIYPGFWITDGLVMSETAILLATTIVILATYRACERLTPGRCAQLGAAIGFSALTRSESILLTPLIVVPLLWFRSRHSDWKPLLLGGVALLSTLAVVTPWVAYNLSRFDRPVTLAATPETALAASNCDDVYYGSDIGYWSNKCLYTLLHDAPEDDAVKAEISRDAATTYIRSHLDRLPLVVVARVGRTWGFYDPIGQVHLDEIDPLVTGREALPVVLGLIMYYLLASAAIFGAFLLRARKVPIFYLGSLVANVTVTVVFLYGQTRFRAAAEPVIVLLAAATVDHLWPRSNATPSEPTSRAERVVMVSSSR